MNPAGGQEHRRSGLGLHPVKTVRHRALSQGPFKLHFPHPGFEPDENFRLRLGFQKEPHLRLGIPSHFSGPVFGRMNLQGKLVLRIQ